MILPRLFFSLLLLVFLVREVPAQNREAGKKPVACTRRYLVDVSDFEPLTIRNKGRLEGLAHDITMELRSRLGCTFIETERSLPVGIENMSSGRSDLALLGAERSGYSKGGHFVRLYTNYREMLVAQGSYRPEWKIEDYLQDKSIKFAHLIGGWNMIDAMQSLVHKVEDASMKVEIGAFISKRRVSAEERMVLEKALDEMKKDGSFLRIFSKYISPQEARHRISE